jgi:hypothetical protein
MLTHRISAARRVTRSMSVKEGDKGSLAEEDETSWDRMLATTMRRFKETKFILAPMEAQSHNGISEGNIRIIKQLLRSHQRLLRGQKTVFKSLIDLQSIFCRISGILNSRPVVYSQTEVITVRDLYCPAFSKSPDDEETVADLLEDTDNSSGAFVELFNISIVKGDFQRFGRKARLNKSCLMANDLVGVYYPSKRGFKYGVIQSTPKGHLVQVLILVRRNQDDVKNVTLLHRPVDV